MIGRRTFALGATLAMAAAHQARAAEEALPAALARIERESGGRLGVAVLDTGSGFRAAHRGQERFPMCSTFKLLLAAAVLARADAGQESLDRRIRIPREALIAHSPVTETRAGRDMSLAELCAATTEISDNAAANLLLPTIGGPAGLTAWLRSIGDAVTRLDRFEPELNVVPPGDERDTTTPAAMLADMQALALGDRLSAPSRAQLLGWMLDCRTNDTRLKAGLPAGWRIGSKTGTHSPTSNDVGILWPPSRAPVLVAAFLTSAAASPERRDGALAAVGRAVAAALA
ncbi:class A beta-lactamase [Plastoroseomonas hellenica]|uniref:class A beta-lactamase n=1 Tax=Plastoroseomonas hellenica TaxID=2687306 RepID=UPI001BABAA65|nr:class A beta-lactamase [Plastoroseomonas hellenica]MBR0642050.1 class A beta-lactamase [Plastoroseomonas hellenica]